MVDVTQMTVTELKRYLSDNRMDNEKFSEALAELLNRDPNPVIYSKDMPLEEQERIFMAKIKEHY
ncbi:MAG: hypothetical protein AB4058_13740 [Microcystaceae cyanobacterium]